MVIASVVIFDSAVDTRSSNEDVVDFSSVGLKLHDTGLSPSTNIAEWKYNTAPAVVSLRRTKKAEY